MRGREARFWRAGARRRIIAWQNSLALFKILCLIIFSLGGRGGESVGLRTDQPRHGEAGGHLSTSRQAHRTQIYHTGAPGRIQYALQMKGRWVSNINVWFPFMYSQKWNCAASLFYNRIIMSVSQFLHSYILYVRDFIFPGLVCLFCCSQICGPILGIYKTLTGTWMWKLGLRPHNSHKRNN